ncbi:MAG: fatty acid hydroxylase [Rhodobacteraceae bacterium]|nr:MAG: fatty acid hydroxylase [Paracoccaceae bacterium]
MNDAPELRLAVFVGLFVLFAILEQLLPRKTRTAPLPRRWLTNWALVIIDSLALRVLTLAIPFMAVGAAVDADTNGWGLFNAVSLPFWVEFILAVLILDLAIWAQHVITHKIPLLWRLHRVHHADTDIDVTTALRFHPVEILFSMILKIGLVYALGPAYSAVIAFEILLNGSAMFNHANIKLPLKFDRILRLVLVTPDMHRVHHSIQRAEHDSNYGFALAIWDRMFGTYIAQPSKGHDDMTIGLEWQDARPTKLGWSLSLPFFKK